jgi:hypothetical protein
LRRPIRSLKAPKNGMVATSVAPATITQIRVERGTEVREELVPEHQGSCCRIDEEVEPLQRRRETAADASLPAGG